MAGSAVIGSLRVSLGLDSAQFTENLKTAQSRLAAFGKAIGPAIAVAGAAAVAAGAAIAAGLKQALDRADEMSQFSARVGVGVEALSKFAYAAQQSDVPLDTLEQGLKKLQVGMAAAADGAKGGAADAFRKLGVAVTDANGKLRPTEDVMADLAEKFAGMEDGAAKTALAVQTFGKSGADMLPFLNNGKDGLAAMAAEAQALGVVLDTKTATAAAGFNDSLDKLKAVGAGITNQLAAALAPTLAKIAELMVGAAKDTNFMHLAGQVLVGTLKTMATVGVVLGTAFKVVAGNISTVAKAFGQVVRGDFSGALQTIASNGKNTFDAIGAAGASLKKIWSDTASTVALTSTKVATSAGAVSQALAAKTKATKASSDADSKAAAEAKAFADRLQNLRDRLDPQGKALRELRQDQLDLRKAFEAGEITADEFREMIGQLEQPTIKATDAFAGMNSELQDVPELLKDARTPAEQLADAFNNVGSAAASIGRAFKKGNFRGLAEDVTRLGDAWSDAFSKETGSAEKKAGAIAGLVDAIGSTIGGKAGKGLSRAANLGLTAFKLTGGNPIATAVAAVVGGLSGILGPRPTNSGAGFDLISGQISGNKRTAETERAAVALADAITQGQDALKSFGVTLTDTIRGVVLGTRDASQIYTTAGKTLTAAVGDVEAAAQVALKSVLGDAQFASEAQKKVALDALAAGKSFEQVVDVLEAFSGAQSLGQSFADAIQSFTDPKGFDLTVLKRQQDARDAQVKAALDAGYLTAQQFGEISDQLVRLKALEVDDVMAKYATAVDEATTTLADASAKARDATAAAADKLAQARDREVDLIEQQLDKYRDVLGDLTAYRDQLRGQSMRAGLESARKAFQNVASLSAQGDIGALTQLRGVSEAFRSIARDNAKTDVEARRADAQALVAAQDGLKAAAVQIDIGQLSLNALNAQVNSLLKIDTSVLGVSAAIEGWRNSLDAQMSALTVQAAAIDTASQEYASVRDEIAGLRADLQAANAVIAKNTGGTVAQLQRFDGDGIPIREVA